MLLVKLAKFCGFQINKWNLVANFTAPRCLIEKHLADWHLADTIPKDTFCMTCSLVIASYGWHLISSTLHLIYTTFDRNIFGSLQYLIGQHIFWSTPHKFDTSFGQRGIWSTYNLVNISYGLYHFCSTQHFIDIAFGQHMFGWTQHLNGKHLFWSAWHLIGTTFEQHLFWSTQHWIGQHLFWLTPLKVGTPISQRGIWWTCIWPIPVLVNTYDGWSLVWPTQYLINIESGQHLF